MQLIKKVIFEWVETQYMKRKNLSKREIRKMPFEKEGAYILWVIIILLIVHTLIVLVLKNISESI